MKNNNKRLCLTVVLCILLAAVVVLSACTEKASEDTTRTLTFETNGGTTIDAIQFKKGDGVTPDTTTKPYFTFDGWYSDKELTTPFDQFDNLPDRDLTVYAKWIAGESGRIIFQTNGGSAVDELTGVVGETIAQPPTPTKDGYLFAGWYTDTELTQSYVFTTFPQGTLTLYAKWSKDVANYNFIIYVVNGVETEIPVASGTRATKPNVGADVECVWYTDADYTVEYDFNAILTSDVTLYGLAYSVGLTFNGNTVTGYNGSSNQIIVPSKYNGQTITTIGAGAFDRNTSIQYVTLPQTVTTIGDYAFYKCEYLVNVNITDSIRTLGKFAFANCIRLVSAIDLGGLSVVETSAFANCSWMTEVNFGDNLTEIGENAFINCTSLTTANLPDSVKSVGQYAFANSAITSLHISGSLISLGKGALKGCSNLVSVTGGNDNFNVNADGTVYDGSTLVLYYVNDNNINVDTFTLPSYATGIAPYAFEGNSSIKYLDVSQCDQPLTNGSLYGIISIDTLVVRDFDAKNAFVSYWFGAKTAQNNTSSGLYVPSSLTTIQFTAFSGKAIGEYAFYGCNGLTSIFGCESATQVGAYAFAYTALTGFDVGKDVTNIDVSAFRGVKTLQQITVDGANANYSSFDGALYDKSGAKLLCVPEAKTEIEFNSNLTEIADGAMYRSQIANLVVPNSVEQIGFGAFEGMNRLQSLTVPFIGASADSNRYMLYVFGATITPTADGSGNINVSADKCPASLKSITISNSVTVIPNYAFAYCTNVSEINCGNGYTEIGSAAFYRSGFNSVTIPDTVTKIGNYAYFGCGNLASVVIGKGVTYVGEFAFASISSITSIVFEQGDNDLTIGAYAFFAYIYSSSGVTNATSNLSKLVLSNNIVSIEYNAFTYVGVSGAVESVNASFSNFEVVFDVQNSRLKTIGDAVFAGAGVSKVVLPASIESIGTLAFYGCQPLTGVTIGSANCEATNLTFIDGGAFAGNSNLTKFTLYKTVTGLKDVPTLGHGNTNYVTGSYGVFVNSTSIQICVPASSVVYYKTAWNTTVNKIADYITAIREA